MVITHGTPVRVAIADLVADAVDAGAAAGRLRIRAGSTLLAEHALSDPAFGGADGGTGVAAASAIADASVVASGTPDNFRIEDSDGNLVFAGSVGDIGSGADLETDIPGGGWLLGGTSSIASGSYTPPA